MDISRATGRSSFSNVTKLLSVVDEVRAVILSPGRGHESDHSVLFQSWVPLPYQHSPAPTVAGRSGLDSSTFENIRSTPRHNAIYRRSGGNVWGGGKQLRKFATLKVVGTDLRLRIYDQ